MNKYTYTMLLSPVLESQLLSSIEGSEAKFIIKVDVTVETDMNEEQKLLDLKSKIGTQTPDGQYEFVGFENLSKIITTLVKLSK